MAYFDKKRYERVVYFDQRLGAAQSEGWSKFRIEVPDPYPHLNGKQIRRASGLSVPTVTFIHYFLAL